MAFLTPCEACNRHVMSSDAACPFCGSEVSAAMRARKPRLPKKRLGRAAMMAFGATVATTTASCGGAEESNDDARQPASSNTMNMNSGPGGESPVTPNNPDGSMTGINSPSNPTSGTMVPNDDVPMAVAAYGVPLVEPEAPPIGVGGQPSMNPTTDPEGGAGGEMNSAGADPGPGPITEPEPAVMALYGAFPVEPVPPALEPEPEPKDMADAGASTDPFMEPEPLPIAEYGVPPVDFE